MTLYYYVRTKACFFFVFVTKACFYPIHFLFFAMNFFKISFFICDIHVSREQKHAFLYVYVQTKACFFIIISAPAQFRSVLPSFLRYLPCPVHFQPHSWPSDRTFGIKFSIRLSSLCCLSQKNPIIWLKIIKSCPYMHKLYVPLLLG